MNLALRLVEHASRRPTDVALTFLVDGEVEEASLSYAELDAAARGYAAELTSRGLAGRRVLIALPSGLDFVAALFGCFYAGVVAAPAPALRLREGQGLGRIDAMARDCAAAALITTPQSQALAHRCPPNSPLAGMPWITSADVRQPHDLALAPTVGEVAFLQYTSGSTADPKGVVVKHENLVANFAATGADMRIGPQTRFLSWLPLHHDMGLIGILLQALYGGNPLVLMSPSHFIQRPLRWLRAISKYRAQLSGGPNFAFNLCVQKIAPQDLEGLRLGDWDVAFNGAEPVRARTLDTFAETFGACGFRRTAFFPCYGMAETTLYIAGRGWREPVISSFDAQALAEGRLVRAGGSADPVSLVSCGQAPKAHRVLIVDPETLVPLPPGAVGEILAEGPSVCDRYWSTPDGFNLDVPGVPGRHLRTGDLGAIFEEELFVTGRRKDLIIVRGRNIYPQDVELSSELACAPVEVGGAVAFSDDAEEGLVVVQEVRRPQSIDLNDLIRKIARAVGADHDVRPSRVVIVQSGALLRSSSGKLQRGANRKALGSGELKIFAETAPPAQSALEGVP